MSGIWWPLILRLVLLAGLAFAAWMIDGIVVALSLATGILLLTVLHHARHLARLSKWLADPRA